MARSRAVGRAYAALVAAVELRLDPDRRAAAERRVRRWLGATAPAARRIVRDSLRSEAREEADCAFFMRYPTALATAFRVVAGVPPVRDRPLIYAILHFGSPILAYLHLCEGGGRLYAIGRALDATNPMPAAKRAWGERKVAWVYARTGRAFLGVDGAAIVRAREHLLAGDSLYAAVDVPGDVAGRADVVSVCGERLRVAAGVPRLATLAHVALQPVLAISRASAIELHYGRMIPATTPAETLVAVTDELFSFVARDPGEWWLWPYVTPADGPTC